ncbi:hypothetical protein B5566_02405 [Mycobacterium sp. MHSD3]|nr:hypothetical protein B5566_02405 [Mycobacterium sp. MHSD3]
MYPNGIPSGEAFGEALVTHPQFVYPEGIASGEAFGTPVTGLSVHPAGIASAEAFGESTVSTGPVDVSPAGIASGEAFGTAMVGRSVNPSGIASAEAFGTAKVGIGVAASGIASAEAFGTATVGRGPVSVSPAGIASAEAFGTAVVAQPIDYVTVGVGSETPSSPTQCSVTPSAGNDVLAFFSVGRGGGGVINATYGASNLPMVCVGQALSGDALIAAFLIRGVASGAATININKTGGNWGQAVAVAYAGAQGYSPGESKSGSGTSFSQSAGVPPGGKVIHAFTPGELSTTLSSLSGGTSRYLDNVGFLAQSVRDANAATTFAGTLSSSRNWAALAVPLLAGPASSPLFGYSIGTSDEGFNGTKTFDVYAATGDYIYVAVAQAGAGDPSSVTCAGTGMTLMDTQVWNSAGFLKIYRSASAMGSSGAKTISVTGTGSNWWRAAGVAVSGVTSPGGTITKTSGSSSQPTQAVTASAGQSVLQAFAINTSPTGTEGGTSLYLSPSVSSIGLILNVANQTTTFKLANTSVTWGAMAVVL